MSKAPDSAKARPLESQIDRTQLKGASISGLSVNMGAQLLRFGLQFAYQIIIARLLAPADFGLVALTAPIIAFVQLFADLGLSQATIQRESISQEQLSFIFWINVAAGAVLSVATILISPVVGYFYGDHRVIAVTMASGSFFLIGGFYTQHLALLNRRMRFLSLAIIDLSSFLIGGAVGITSALLGAGYWAIIANQAGASLASLALAWALARWRPNGPAHAHDAKAILKFGGDLTGFNLVNYFSRNLDNVLIGKFNGETSLGLYDRAYKLLLLPLNQISTPLSRVALPLLSRIQNEPIAYRRAFLRLLEAMLILTYPAVLFALVTSHDLINIVLGSKWSGVAPLFSILAVGALTAPISNSTGWLFISQGRTREMRNTGIVSSLIYVVSFICGLPWGPVGVATCYIVAGLLRSPFVWRRATSAGAVSFSNLLAALYPYLIAAGLTVGATYGASHILRPGLATLAVLFCLAHLTFALTVLAIPGSRATIADILRQTTPRIPGLRRTVALPPI